MTLIAGRPFSGGPGRRREPHVRKHLGARGALATLACVVLAGCASYHAKPLPAAADLASSFTGLKVDMATLRLGPLKSTVVDPSDGLDPTEVAVLAVLNDPDLRAKRAAVHVSGAQVFAAGLLPDPQISGGVDRIVAGPDTQQAYSVSPSLDLTGLLARSNTLAAARFTAKQADLDLLWAEWQVAQQARQLAVTAVSGEARAGWLRRAWQAAGDRSARSEAAQKRGDLSAAAAAADLAVTLDAQALLRQAEHDAAKARRDLNALLNLQPDVRLPLVLGARSARYSPEELRQALTDLTQRRPDLLALKAGYSAQDANVRRAILAQFPVSSLALNFAKDTTGNITQGIAAVAALPIFNGGRGEVAVQNATRDQLYAEYQARLDLTRNEVAQAEAELASADSQAAALGVETPKLEALVAPASAAISRGDIDSQAYLAIAQSALTRRADLDDKTTAALLAEIALETALFLPPAQSKASQ